MDINFELYKIFYHAASSGSFSEAAAKLFITQSAVSQAIKNLEKQTESRLFYRQSRTVRLTREGELLFRHIEQAYNFIKAGEDKITQLKNMESGEIRIGIGDTICKYFLIPHLEEFIRRFPKVKTHVVNRTSTQIIAALENGVIDMGIVTLPVNNKKLEVAEFIRVEDIFVACNRFSAIKDKTISLQKLSEYPLLMLEKDSSTRKLIDSFLAEHQIHVLPEIELESIDLLVEFAKIGLGIAHVLKESAADAIRAGELFEVRTDIKPPPRKLGIITMKDLPLSTVSLKFKNQITSHATLLSPPFTASKDGKD